MTAQSTHYISNKQEKTYKQDTSEVTLMTHFHVSKWVKHYSETNFTILVQQRHHNVYCTRENNQDIIEDLTHATYTCPYIQPIIEEITNTYFPNIHTNFTHRDTLLAIII